MAQSIKYRFDEVMLRYVKELRIKTTAFGGYDRDDVYEKIKDLISEARTVCEEVYEEAVSELQDETAALDAAHETAASDISLDQDRIDGLLQEIVELEARVVELEAVESKLSQEVKELQAKLNYFDENDEKLERANEILREARLEADRIIVDAKEKGEQEVLLGRARSRAESEEAQKDLEDLRKKSEKLREYLKSGAEMQKQMQTFAESFVLDDDLGLTSKE
ncbi:MAG: hypothetical protein PHR78_01050 [Eubacteriales bacterium]|nr:hypothetical protein [Eubacteriales bacterium]MDD4324141.1 hypothetical protein [Eubacteriales bacterium]MDD4540744.1 hypothetical protein [Eubacteriales bacterium]